MKEITIVIPVYNDSNSLEILLEKILNTGQPQLNFLIVDNGSSQPLELETKYKLNSRVRFVRASENLGFGGGIMLGIAHADTEYVGWMPGNLKVDPADVAEMLSQFELEPQLVLKASRSGRRLSPRLKTLLAGTIQSILLRSNMLDSGGTPTICSKEFIINLKNPPTDYVFESFVLYKARKSGMKIIRPNVPYGARVYGQSHWQRGLRSELLLLKLIYTASRNWAATKNG